MRSVSDWIVATRPKAEREKAGVASIAAAAVIALVAGGFAGGAVWLAYSSHIDQQILIVQGAQ